MLRDGFQVKIWDPRAPGCQGAHSQPDKVSVYAVHTLWPYLPRARLFNIFTRCIAWG